MYLMNAPVLSPPVPGRPLLIYVSITETALGAEIAQHDDTRQKERAIDYLSQTLLDYETRYTQIDKPLLRDGSLWFGQLKSFATTCYLTPSSYWLEWILSNSYVRKAGNHRENRKMATTSV